MKNRYIAVAIQVLADAEEPLSLREIMLYVEQRNLLTTSGKTPERTMASCIYVAVRDDPSCPIERVGARVNGRGQSSRVRWQLRSKR